MFFFFRFSCRTWTVSVSLTAGTKNEWSSLIQLTKIPPLKTNIIILRKPEQHILADCLLSVTEKEKNTLLVHLLTE